MTLPAIYTLSTYGGAMANYAPVEDPTTDRDATAANQAYASAAAATHTTPRAWARFTAAASTGAMVLVAHDAVWGTSVPPTLARTSAGIFTVTWPATITDELGTVQTVALRAATATYEGAVAYFAGASATVNIATINVGLGTTGALNDAVGVNILVVAY